MAEQESLWELYWTVGRALRHSARDALAGWDLSPSLARALGSLATDDPIRLGELAQRLRIAPRSATEVVDQLEERGLAERVPDPGDRRATTVRLTDEGATLAETIAAARADQAEVVFDLLGESDRTELARLLGLLRDRVGDTGHHGGHRGGRR